jgi:hypothetical protein
MSELVSYVKKINAELEDALGALISRSSDRFSTPLTQRARSLFTVWAAKGL